MSENDTGWPPPAKDMWLVHGTMGAAVEGLDATGAGKYVMLRVGSRRNHEETVDDDRTYVLDLHRAVGLMAGMIRATGEAFGREAMTAAMAEAMLLTPEDRHAAAVEAARRLRAEDPLSG